MDRATMGNDDALKWQVKQLFERPTRPPLIPGRRPNAQGPIPLREGIRKDHSVLIGQPHRGSKVSRREVESDEVSIHGALIGEHYAQLLRGVVPVIRGEPSELSQTQ